MGKTEACRRHTEKSCAHWRGTGLVEQSNSVTNKVDGGLASVTSRNTGEDLEAGHSV